jgi:hypothetical protein
MTLKNRSRNGVAVSADFEKPSSPPPRKAVPVLKSKSLTCFKFRFLRRPLVGFRMFKITKRAARNPATGDVIQIAACNAPTFSAGKTLKSAVN